MLTVEDVLQEYFLNRKDGGSGFNVKSQKDLYHFESFLIKNGYIQMFDRKKLNELFEADDIPQESSTEELVNYVKKRYVTFFKTQPSAQDLESLVNYVREFRKTNQSIESAFQFLKQNPALVVYEKNQIGQGEFAFYLLLPEARKIAGDKGDIWVGDKKYEIKKLKKAKDTIRFGTNIDLDAINSFRYVTFGLKKLFTSKEYKDGEKIKEMSSAYDKLMDGSEASVAVNKLNAFYKFIDLLRDYVIFEKTQKSLSSEKTAGKNFIFKANDVDKDVFFKISFDDLKNALKSGKQQTTVEKTEDKQDTEELTSFAEEVQSILNGFLNKYPTSETFQTQMVAQLYEKYRSVGVHIMIINEKNEFLIDPPNFKFNAINQFVRPQVTLG
jgi:hypothetical protein